MSSGIDSVGAFTRLLGAFWLNADRSPFTQAKDRRALLQHVADEVKEASDALASETQEVFEGEVGDIWATLLTLTIRNEQLGGVPLAQILANAEKKLRLRKPWIFDRDYPQPETAEEEQEWYTLRKAELRKAGKT